jgi:hypothetical protein
MTLSALIKKGGLAKAATATLATIATQDTDQTVTVAAVAAVAVANPQVGPLDTHKRESTAPMSESEESAIRAWLAHIEETNPDEIADVLDKCRTNSEARAYFLLRAQEIPLPHTSYDDRRHCTQCVNLTRRGQCLAAKRSEITASSSYYPVDHIPRRCKGYAPGPDDPDRRSGRERWPNLNQTGGNHANE